MKYTIQVADECLVAPLSLFNTELLNVTGTGKAARVQKPASRQPDPEDCFDAEYLRETSVWIPFECSHICSILIIFVNFAETQRSRTTRSVTK